MMKDAFGVEKRDNKVVGGAALVGGGGLAGNAVRDAADYRKWSAAAARDMGEGRTYMAQGAKTLASEAATRGAKKGALGLALIGGGAYALRSRKKRR